MNWRLTSKYFAAGLMVSEKLTSLAVDGKTALFGMDAAGASSAPIGDMAKLLGNYCGGRCLGRVVELCSKTGT